MTMRLLPDNFDDLVRQAVTVFWSSRSGGSNTQGGSRGNVISGKNLDGFLGVVVEVARHCGIPDSAVFTTGRSNLTLPGYYRPNKNWDVVIVYEHRLISVLEFKSQVGSFGNNFNNRSEEVIGNAADLWVAARKGAYHPNRHKEHAGEEEPDPRAPFLGYLMLLQDCTKSTRPVRADSPHYHIFPRFQGASYADRYRILCESLMEENLYGAASLMLSSEDDGSGDGGWRSLSDATDVKNLFTQLAARLMAAVQS
jgi:Restriction endonuclease XhoI